MADGYPDEIYLISLPDKAVSMQYALSKGFASTYALPHQKDWGVKMDLETDSPGKRAIDKMIGNAITILEESPALKQLMAKPEWTMKDREQWEASIANIVRDQIYEEERFGTYRLDKKKPTTPISITEITKDSNFHCEPMSALSGIMLQKIENHFLQPNEDRSKLKRRTDYYLTGGILYRSSLIHPDKTPKQVREELRKGEILHGFVVSPITANYIEGTSGRPNGWHGPTDSAYKKNDIPGYAFEDYLAGFPMLSNKAGFTLGYEGSKALQKLAHERKEALKRGDYAFLEANRADVSKQQFNWQVFADERNFLMMHGVCESQTTGSVRTLDTNTFIDKLLAADPNLKGAERSYTQLSCDAKNVDFAVTEDEMNVAVNGNRLHLWANNKFFAQTMLDRGIAKVSGRSEWIESDLSSYLAAHGIDNVWAQRVIPKNVVPSANNFESIVREYYDALPAQMLTFKTDKGETKIPFSEYLEFCKAEYLERKGKPELINASGTVVPVIFNPARLYELAKLQNGRTVEEFEHDEGKAMVYSSATINNWPGVNRDKIDIMISGVINGFRADWAEDMSIAIPESVGEIPDPLPSKPIKETKQSARRTSHP